MSYQSVAAMAGSQSLKARLIACAANEGKIEPQPWVEQHLWTIVSKSKTWADAWDLALLNDTLKENPDTGNRPDVITDVMIRTQIQAVMAEEVA